MKIDIEKLNEQGTLYLSGSIDFSERETNDALVKCIKRVDVNINAIALDDGQYHVNLEYTPYVTYLDARNLNPLELTFEYKQDIIFSSDFQKAEEFELEYFEGEEIELTEIIFDLTCVSLPINYSEDESGTFLKESEDTNEYKPFAGIFNK